MSLVTDDSTTRTSADPQALIDEARRRQRQRARRRNAVFGVVALLVVLGIGIGRLVRGGGGAGVQAALPAAVSSVGRTPTVTYEKLELTTMAPHFPTDRRTIETWTSSQPYGRRVVVTIAGGPRLEIASRHGHDDVLGALLVGYLYDASTKTIYRTGYRLWPSAQERIVRTDRQWFRRFRLVLATPGVRLVGTSAYRRRSVYVVEWPSPKGTSPLTTYFDRRTYAPLMVDSRGGYFRRVHRLLAYRVLPATKPNLALVSLWSVHPHAHTVLHASLRIRKLFEGVSETDPLPEGLSAI